MQAGTCLLLTLQALGTIADFSSSGNSPEVSTGAKKEQDLVDQGKMPGLAEVQKDTQVRKPGEEDAAGNKIHHRGVLGHILHWEHSGMNADK